MTTRARSIPTRVLRAVAAIPWAMSPQWLATLISIARRDGPGPEAVAAELGRELDNAHTVTIRDGVACIPITGPIFRRANIFSDVSGATSTEVIALDLRQALTSPEVTAIILDIDSPGGEAAGIHELAAMVFAARGAKPIVAYVGGTGASAAYWLAAACDKIVADETAILGSIGVVICMPGSDPADTDVELVSSNAPNKRPDVTTDEGRATVQAMVDALADVFVADVAKYRATTPAKVVSDFGAGGVLVGAQAVAAGMADALGSLESTIAQLAAAASLPSPPAPLGARATSLPVTPSASRAAKDRPMSTASLPAAEAPAAPTPADDKSKADDTDAAAPPADDSKNCEGCKAVSAGSAKYCAGCGAAFPAKVPGDDQGKDDGDGDEDEDEPASSEDPEAVVAGLVAITGAKTGRLAVAAVMRWKHAATVDLPKARSEARAEALDVISVNLKQSGKLTPALDADLRALAALDHGSFVESALALAAGKQIAGLAPQSTEPTKLGGGTCVAITLGGKSFEQLSYREQADLKASDLAMYDAMLADASKRGALR